MTGRSRYRVIVVDDYPEAAEITCQLLGLLGHDCHAAETSAQALAYVEQGVPDLAILDLGLPDMSNYELVRELRRVHGPTMFLVAMTGWGLPEDQARASEAGFDAFLLKPIGAKGIPH